MPGEGKPAAKEEAVEEDGHLPVVVREVGLNKVLSTPLFTELVRSSLTIIFALLLTLTIILGYVGRASGHWAQTKEWLQIVLPAETALLGSAVGFYFGTKKNGQ